MLLILGFLHSPEGRNPGRMIADPWLLISAKQADAQSMPLQREVAALSALGLCAPWDVSTWRSATQHRFHVGILPHVHRWAEWPTKAARLTPSSQSQLGLLTPVYLPE